MKKLYILFFIAGITFCSSAFGQLVYKDVASIFYNPCTKCHHAGGGAPFSMMNYSETSPWCSMIQTDLTSGKMPVWPPDTTYSRFLHERIITASQKTAILNWITDGCTKGDTTLAPPAPTYVKYQLYGTPSLVLQIPTFTSNASSTDAYDCFALPSGLTQDMILRAYEIVPGNPAIVHHVIVNVDTTGTVTSDLSGTCFSEPGQFSIGGYALGAPPTVYPGVAPLKAGVRIKAGSTIILQIHYPVGTAGKVDSTIVRMYFYPIGTTGIRPIYTSTPLQNWSLAIPANTTATFTAKYPSSGGVPVALSVFAAFPHSHKVCTSITNYADSNGTNTIPLIRINKWDFNWQGYYTYAHLLKIPAGYTLHSSHFFDNTTNNVNNPFSPPQLITAGTSTTNEMLFDSFQYLLYQPGDDTINIGNLLAHDSLLNPAATSVNEITALQFSVHVYPNPFSDFVKIGYELNYPASTSVSIYNIYGSKIKNLSSQFNPAGAYSVYWDGKNESGTKVPDGVYFYTIRAGKSAKSGKVVLMPR